MKDMVVAACLLLEAAGSAFAAEHQKPHEGIDRAPACSQKKRAVESKFQVYFEAHRAVEDGL